MKKTVTIPIELDAEVLARDLADSLNYAEAINIIKIIDDQIADWEFTKQLAAFFMNEVLKEWNDQEARLFEIGQFIDENLPESV